jgi:predicted nuclease of restriction endonuclease-like (RecB) superfamily
MSRHPAKPKPSNPARPERQIVKPPRAGLPSGYAKFLEDVKSRIRTAQVKAALSVNRELIQLYWDVGKTIVEAQKNKGYGKQVVERLSADLQKEFPGVAGFSAQNLWKMRAFYLAWTDEVRNLSQVVRKTEATANLSQPVREFADENLQQAVRELDGQNLPQVVAEVPWGHNIELLFKLKSTAERLWYARKAVEHGWSRAVLVHWIESDLYSRQGKAVTNFPATLPPAQSDLVAEVIKDPYSFDFLTLGPAAAERQLERGLLDHIRQFLLELGAGFAFVGQQVHLEIGGEDFYLDLLFYHLRLRCFVVIDLKARPFKPEYVGKMNFYLSAVDDLLRHPDDQPSIGLILCKTRNKIVAEYALRDLAKPVGVARYVTRLVEKLPTNLKGALPAPRDIEAEFGQAKGKRTGKQGRENLATPYSTRDRNK